MKRERWRRGRRKGVSTFKRGKEGEKKGISHI